MHSLYLSDLHAGGGRVGPHRASTDEIHARRVLFTKGFELVGADLSVKTLVHVVSHFLAEKEGLFAVVCRISEYFLDILHVTAKGAGVVFILFVKNEKEKSPLV